MSTLIDLTGQTFGSLTVLRRTPVVNRHKGESCWLCCCVCGTERAFRSDKLRGGRARSCGCLNPVCKPTHRMSGTPEYLVWRGMHKRCYDPRHVNYKRYGGRGIEVRFKSFEEFYTEVGPRPSPKHSVDRIENNGHYEPGNVRWATAREQSGNRRPYPSVRASRRRALRTHCSHGHELTDDNVYLGPRNSRRCKKCALLDSKRRQPQYNKRRRLKRALARL